MTQRNDAAIMALHASSESDEPHSVMQPISSMCAPECIPDEPSHDEARIRSEALAAVGSEASTTDEALTLTSDGELGRGDRPTLMGLAPFEHDTSPEDSSHEPTQPTQQAEPSTVRSAPLLTSDASLLSPSPVMPAPEQAQLPDEADSEWLDLSTRWLVATGPRADQQVSDETEATESMHWADRLSVRLSPRAETHSFAPAPPQPQPQPQPQPIAAQASLHRVTMAFGRPSEAPALDAPAAFDALGPRPRAFAGEASHAGRPSGEPNPWREEPSYSEGRRPRQPSWAAGSHAAPVSALPPWATLPATASPPSDAVTQPYSAAPWNAPHMPGNFRVPLQAGTPPAAYAPKEWRASKRTDYAPPRRVLGATARPRPARVPQQNANQITLEQWKSLADGWVGALGKLAIAAMALHLSGLAVPLLAHFGYAPAAPLAGTGETMARAPTATATLAASSFIVEPERPPLTATRSDVGLRRHEHEREHEHEQANEAASIASELDATALTSHRRPTAKREVSSTIATSTRRRSAKPAHKPTTQASSQTAHTSAPPTELQAEPSATPQPLLAAAPESEEPVGEALLRINSRPWSQVFVDGTLVGHTPKLDLRVSAGNHRIRLVNTDLGLTKTIELRAAAGETVSRVELLDE